MQSLPESRSSLRLTAMLAAGILLLTTVPSPLHAEDEKLSLVMPRGGEVTGGPQGERDDGFSPATAPVEQPTVEAASGRPSVMVQMERADTHELLTIALPPDGRLGADD